MANNLHTMPLKVERLFSSMRFRRMKWDEKGAYILLLAEAWLEGGKLPNCPMMIRRLLGIEDDKTWSRIEKFVLEQCFEPSEDGNYLINKTQVEIYEETASIKNKNVEKAKKAAKARWRDNNSNEMQQACNKHATSNAQAMHMQGNQSQSQNQSQNQIKEDTAVSSKVAIAATGKNPMLNPPTPDDVRLYAESIGYAMNSTEVEKFVNMYSARGWRDRNDVPIRNWQPIVSNWKANSANFKKQGRNNSKSGGSSRGESPLLSQRAVFRPEDYSEDF